MKTKIFKQILYVVLLLLSVNLASAANMTIEDLINSYDYSYSDGTLNTTSQNDYMEDRNSNGINDTLMINITTDAATSGTYRFIVEIIDKNGVLTNETNVSINSSYKSANISFASELLSKARFNYSIRIYNSNDDLVFRKLNVESQTYLNYEAGTNITKVTDENINNNFIRINLTINSTQAITTNITVTLAYNSSKISKTNETTLSNGIQVVSIDFDNETIKSTHYVGNFTIDNVVIGDKIFDFNQNTSIYNYEDFAKTSYIKSITDGRIDTNANNLSEFLEINFTINVKTTDIYNITYELYDQFDNYVISVNKTAVLSLGNQTVQTLINGSEIYKTKINGPYVLSFAKLAIGNDTKDIIFDAYTTNQSFYTDYERPPLPDLLVNMTVVFNSSTNITNITINLSNIGQSPAFNVFLDIFDNTTYTNNRTVAFLGNNESLIYSFNITNSSNTTLFTAIADFDNLVDESNESNNIVQNTKAEVVSLAIESLTAMYSNGTMKIFEVAILNDGDAAVTDIQWWFDTNDSYRINSTSNLSSLAANEKAFVYLQYNFSDEGSYNLRANATGLRSSTSVSSLLSSTIGVGDLAIINFDDLNMDISKVIFEIQAQSNLLENLTSLNWSLTTGNGQTINSTSLFSPIRPNETIFMFIAYDYGASGTFSPIATVTNTTYSDSRTITIDVQHIEAYNLSVVNESETKRIFEFIVKNNLNTNLTNVNWTFDTKNSNVINATSLAVLQPSEIMFIYLDYNFTSSNTFNTNATAINGSLRDSRNLTITIT